MNTTISPDDIINMINTTMATSNSTTASSSSDHSSTSTNILYSYEERVFVAVCWAIIAVLGTTGNSLIFISVLLSRKLRTATNVFVVNLAAADFLTSLFMSWSVVALVGRDGWPIPEAEWLCSVAGFMIFLCTGVSLYNLAAIAVNRLVLITQSFDTYKRLYKPMNVGVMAALIWIIPSAIFVGLPLAGIGGFGYDRKHSTCSDLDHHPEGKTFELVQTIVFYPIPLITIVVCYVLVFKHVKRHLNKQRTLNDSSSANGSAVDGNGNPRGIASADSQLSATTTMKSPRSGSRAERIDQMEIEITKNLFLVVCAFFLFFSPYCIALFIPGTEYFLLYGGISVLANSAINPLIYSRRHPHFKVVFSSLLRCRYKEIPEPSNVLKRFLPKKPNNYV